MNIQTFKKLFFGIFPALLVTFSLASVYPDQGGVVQTYKNATAPFDDEKSVDSVMPLPDDTVPVKIRYQGGLFWTETRKDKVERFQCNQCHNDKDVKLARAAEIAHGDIVIVHGERGKPLSCFTCHHEDDRDFLVNEESVTIDMDHSYQLCAQCHFREKKDWVGGAHGKRVAYWAGRRVVKNCTSCHNPHAPRFEKRWPETYSPPINK